MTRAQLRERHVADSTIAGWVEVRRLIPVHAGVYAVGHVQTTPTARAAAAVLAAGLDAALSHDSAAALWGLRRWPAVPEVITTTRWQIRRPGIRAHRSTTLTRHDIRHQAGIRTTSPARTIADIARRLTDRQLTRAVNDARLAGILPPTELRQLLKRCARAARLIDPHDGATRSPGEDALRLFLTAHGFTGWHINHRVAGYEVDVLFPREKVIVELDGWAFHRDRASFETDRERDAATTAAGHVTVRLTTPRLNAHPRREADRLRAIIRSRRPSAPRNG